MQNQSKRRKKMREKYGRTSLELYHLEKVMPEEELWLIVKEYQKIANPKGHNKTYKPSELDLALYREWMTGKKTENEAAKAMGVSTGTVFARFAKISKMMASN